MTVQPSATGKAPFPKVAGVSSGHKIVSNAEHRLNAFVPILSSCVPRITFFNDEHPLYLQPIITQYFIDNKSEIWLLFLIAHSKR